MAMFPNISNAISYFYMPLSEQHQLRCSLKDCASRRLLELQGQRAFWGERYAPHLCWHRAVRKWIPGAQYLDGGRRFTMCPSIVAPFGWRSTSAHMLEKRMSLR